MPELPEVETTSRYLRDRILGEEIAGAEVLWSRSVSPLSVPNFSEAIKSRKILGVGRRGKFVVIALSAKFGAPTSSEPLTLLIHLRMSGSLEVLARDLPIDRHDRIVIHLGNGKGIRFNDTRKFGRMYLLKDPHLVTGKLGIEPLGESFTTETFQQILSKTRGAVKPALLKQELVCGIGNIYADEALWRSKIHPLRLAAHLRFDEVSLLRRAIQGVLVKAIEGHGTDFGDGVVEYGNYVPKVYGREEQPCSRCRSRIRKIVVAQRGTHFCPKCQMPPREKRTARTRANGRKGN